MSSFDNVKLENEIDNIRSEGKDVSILINETFVQWSFKNSEKIKKLSSKNGNIEWKDVIGVEARNPKSKSAQPDPTKYVTIYYICKSENFKWKCQHRTFEGDFSSWFDIIKEKSQKDKPKRLLVIINPVSGFGKGRQIYEKQVAPLFKLADITTEVIVTQKAKEAIEIAKTHDLSTFNGFICVGGDGIYHEIVNGLLERAQLEKNIDINDVEATLSPVSIPVGLIPAGTGNGVAGWMNGIIDVETSVLHVIRGEVYNGGVLDINVNNKHVLYGGLLFAYGFMSDIIKKAESRRWMKVFRYPVTMLGGFAGSYRVFHGEVKYKTKEEDDNNEEGSGNLKESEWQKVDLNEFLSVHVFSADLDLTEDRYKISLQEPTMHLMCYPGVPKMQHMKFWGRYMTQKSNVTSFDWLRYKSNITRFHITTNQKTEGRTNYREEDQQLESYCNIDGESILIEKAELEVRYCPQVVPLFCENFAFKTSKEIPVSEL